MSKKDTKIQKLIFFLLIISIFLPALIIFSKPKKAEAIAAPAAPVFDVGGTSIWTSITSFFSGATTASTATNTAISIKNVAKAVVKETLKMIARRALQEMTKSTVNWINTGFHGQPLFLENPGSFFQDIGKTEVKKLVDTIGYDRLRMPFGKQIALEVIGSYKRQSSDNLQYTLSKVINDPALLERYRADFNVGGWNGFLVNTQYPQNNYLGSKILVSEQLGRKLEGVNQNAAQKVQATLQQGQGFLSPQMCSTNPKYNNGINEFNKPSFSYKEKYSPPKVNLQDVNSTDPVAQARVKAFQNYDKAYNDRKYAAQVAWATKNECPPNPDGSPGLINTTPGSVVSNSIMKALDSQQEQGTINQAIGASLSSVFDALLNHFLQRGLNSLSSQINPKPKPDDWNYDGVTLGSPETDINGQTDIFGGPDEEIILDQFKEEVAQAIDNTEAEIELMDNEDPTNPGIIQLIALVPEQTQKLDQCLPGPDKGWEERLISERERNSRVLSAETNSTTDLKVKAATDAIRELKWSVAGLKEWIITKMISSLPGATIYIDAVKEIDEFPQQIKESTDAKRLKNQTVARLKALEISLSAFTKQPESTDTNFTSQEKKLISIRKQYNAIKPSISNTNSIEDTRSELSTLKDRLSNLEELNTECEEERIETERGVSVKNSPTEISEFCGIPIISGYSHGDIIRPDESNQHGALKFTFRNPHGNEKGDPGFEDLPMVNASGVYGDDTKKLDPVVIDIDCNIVFKVKPTYYTQAGDPTF